MQDIDVMIHVSNERNIYCRIVNTGSLRFNNDNSIKSQGKRLSKKDQDIENLKSKT